MHLIDLDKNFIGSTAIVSGSIPVGVGFAYSLLLKIQKIECVFSLGTQVLRKGIFES